MISVIRWPLVALALVATVTITWLAVGGGGTVAGSDRADPDDAELVALGEQVYADQCASCHGAQLEGQPDWKRPLPEGGYPAPPHDQTGHTWHHGDDLLFAYTKLGGEAVVGGDFTSHMPGFADLLSDREISAVLAFIKSRWPADIQQRQLERNGG